MWREVEGSTSYIVDTAEKQNFIVKRIIIIASYLILDYIPQALLFGEHTLQMRLEDASCQ